MLYFEAVAQLDCAVSILNLLVCRSNWCFPTDTRCLNCDSQTRKDHASCLFSFFPVVRNDAIHHLSYKLREASALVGRPRFPRTVGCVNCTRHVN